MMPVNVCLPGAAANAATANRKSRCFVIFRFFWKPFRNGQPSKFVNSDLCDFASSAEGAGVYHSRATPGLRNRPVRPGGVQESSALAGRTKHLGCVHGTLSTGHCSSLGPGLACSAPLARQLAAFYSPGVMRCAVDVPAFMIHTVPCLLLSGNPVDAVVAPGKAMVMCTRACS